VVPKHQVSFVELRRFIYSRWPSPFRDVQRVERGWTGWLVLQRGVAGRTETAFVTLIIIKLIEALGSVSQLCVPVKR